MNSHDHTTQRLMAPNRGLAWFAGMLALLTAALGLLCVWPALFCFGMAQNGWPGLVGPRLAPWVYYLCFGAALIGVGFAGVACRMLVRLARQCRDGASYAEVRNALIVSALLFPLGTLLAWLVRSACYSETAPPAEGLRDTFHVR